MQIRIILSIIMMSAACAVALGADISISGTSQPALVYTPEATTGLDAVYVVNDMTGARASYTASASTSSVKWQKYDSRGGGYATEITDGIEHTGGSTKWTLTNLEGDCGYIVEEQTAKGSVKNTYFWVVDYSRHRYSASSLTLAAEEDACYQTVLNFEGNAKEINYYSITGRICQLNRDLVLSYTSLVEEDGVFKERKTSETLQYVNQSVYCEPTLTATAYTLSGDRWLREWGEEVTVTSSVVTPQAVAAIVTVEQQVEDAPNQIPTGSDSELGGSAPVDILMNAEVSPAGVYTEWQMSDDPEFSDFTMRINEPKVDFTFREAGTTYMRFVTANASGSCEWVSEVYTIVIGESRLLCPNAFSPEDRNGVNDEWRVSYTSIIDFDCHIYNLWGVEVAHLTSPEQGWDGTYRGKLVPPGVYYYVINATGSDQRKYNLSGDINIVGYK